jgi:hypothetical protein
MAQVPDIENRCICIADGDAVILTAVISSYLFKTNFYLPFFTFPAVTGPKIEGEDHTQSDVHLSNLLGVATAVFINNAWARMRGSEHVILAGLSADQVSYLSFPTGTRVIEIAGLTDVHLKLSALSLPNQPELRCKPSDVLNGLFMAENEGKRLTIDENAELLPKMETTRAGVVVVEDNEHVGSVVAVNYASAVQASLLVVPPIGKRDVRVIHRYIQEWRDKGDEAQLRKVKDAVNKRLNGTSFSECEFATFFTEGLPYSLVVENVIPCSYVHLSVRPDLFLFNSIVFEHIKTFHSAVVFSPLFFPDEETDWLTKFFTHNNYYLRQLVGPNATFADLDFTAQHYPYSLLHICSHGGEVDGWEVSEEFVDRDGKTHILEYDEVVGFNSVPDKDGRIAVHRKTIFRSLDGFPWMSEELDKQNIPQYVFHDMWKALYQDQRTKINPNAKRKKKGRIATSCAIRCADSIHQGEFNILASHSSPLVFNNTCWSWYEVALFFLSCGARGYIGTLWAIENTAAVLGAQTFYSDLFSGTILAAFHKAVGAINGTQSKDVYIYWGLHFTTLSPGHDSQEGRGEVFKELLLALAGWRDQIEATKSEETKRNATRVLKSLLHELNTNFGPEDLKKFELEIGAGIMGRFREDDFGSTNEDRRIAVRSSIDHPTEYKRSARPDADQK